MSGKKKTKAKHIYRFYLGDKIHAEVDVRDGGNQATEIETMAKEEANKICVPVRVARGKLAGGKFQEEFSTIINPDGWQPKTRVA